MFYPTLLFLHSIFRWLVLSSIAVSIFLSLKGYLARSENFPRLHNALRHTTATIAHIQLMLGILIYAKSPVVKDFYADPVKDFDDSFFFGLVHIALMLTAVILITIGSAKAKRQEGANGKYKMILAYFTAALLLIFIAVPWPFSPLAQRPILRTL